MAQPSRFKMERRKLRAALQKTLTNVFINSTVQNEPGIGPIYFTSVKCFTLQTWIDVGGSHHQLSYDHKLCAKSDEWLIESTDMLTWLGIGRTYWSYLTDDDVPIVVESIGKMCSLFVNAVSGLVEGLSVDG